MSITTDRHGPIVLFTLNRPEARNALSPDARDKLESELLAFDRDPDLRVAILTGAGETFCAGADLKVQAAPVTGPAAHFDHDNRSLVRDLGLAKPLIAAINGAALGGGLELALLCDIRVAATTATFALPEVKIGSMPGSGGTQRLARIIGLGNALHVALTGERLNADDALRVGLVTRLVPPEALIEEAMAIARRIAENAPLSVRATRAAIREGADLTLAQGLKLERMYFTALRDSEDRAEGRKAFAEKRRPNFKGR
jgi:(E)-benzylidenesuccinyl-CoA hydratase